MESIGVCIIATQKRSYGEMAFNLAVSLKAVYDVPISVISDGQIEKILRYDQWIDSVIPAPDLNPFEIKVNMWDLSPYEKTLYIDADSLYTGTDLKGFLETINRHGFLIGEYKRWEKGEVPKKYTWAKFPEIWKHYRMKPDMLFAECNSSMFFFDRSKANEKLFRAVKDAYASPVKVNKTAGGHFPDEVAWGVGCGKSRRFSSIPGWMPCYFNWHSNKRPEHYDFISMAGKHQPKQLITAYNRTMCRNAVEFGLHKYRFNSEGKLYAFR